MDRREEILSRVSSVPYIPPSAVKVFSLFQEPDVNIPELTRAIELDQGLTTNILRLANSAYFGRPRSVNSVRDAILVLGTTTVFQLVVSSLVAPLTKHRIHGYHLPPGELLRHSIAVAVGADKIASALHLTPVEYTFTAALVHDIGKVILGTFLEVDAEPIVSLAYNEKVSFEQAEQRVLGIDHAEVGACLLDSWNLPYEIVHVVRWHHEPERFPGNSSVCELVHVADTLSLMEGIGTGIDGLNYQLSTTAVAKLHMTRSVAEGVLCSIMEDLEELTTVFFK